MFGLRKNYVMDENQQPIAVQISIDDFQRLEEILEDYGLARLMDQVSEDNRERFSKEEGIAYYRSIETAYLLSSTPNAAHLAKSIEQFKQGNIVEKGLNYEN